MEKIKVIYNACFGGFSLSEAAELWLAERGLEFDRYETPRHHPLLVECVEELGDAAGGSCAEPRVCELIGDAYIIREYDGRESVLEPQHIEFIRVEPAELVDMRARCTSAAEADWQDE